jgi:hypothetical protein
MESDRGEGAEQNPRDGGGTTEAAIAQHNTAGQRRNQSPVSPVTRAAAPRLPLLNIVPNVRA